MSRGVGAPWTQADDEALRAAIRAATAAGATFPVDDLGAIAWDRIVEFRPELTDRTRAALIHRAKHLGLYKPAHGRRSSPPVPGAISQPGMAYRPEEDALLRRLVAVEWPGALPMIGAPPGFWARAAERFVAAGYGRNAAGLCSRAATLGLWQQGLWVDLGVRSIPVGATAPLPYETSPAKAERKAPEPGPTPELTPPRPADRETRWVEIDGRVVRIALGRISAVRGLGAYTRVDHTDGSVALVPVAVERFVAEWERLLLDSSSNGQNARPVGRESEGVS